MTIRTKRRGWRSLAAILAAMLMASVLAVVAGAPAQAANTASEALVDTNDDGRPDSRAFAGDDRYDTALRLAKHFAHNDTPNAIDTVIVASGETQIDAVAAAGVAGYEEAPVLLTRRDQLPKGVATFIEDQGVSQVFVAGGTAVISDDVVEQIEGLDSSPTVMRVAGDNRYGTAAALAGKILSTARWCGSDDSAVFLANGNQVPITSAIMAGPMSYRMQMPLLLTAADALPTETSEYIDDNDVDRVVIIGNAGEVSADVADEIAALGASVDRVAGDDAASTSVEVAKLMWGDCDGLPTDTGRVALVNSEATVDGVTGGPVAGRGLANNDRPMAILLVGDSLPDSVRDWLAATPDEAGSQKTHLSIVAIGGTAVVSNAVMAAAVDAANTAPGLTTNIRPVTSNQSGHGGTTMFTVTFSDELDMNAPNWKRQLSDVFYVNGQLASIEDEVGDINETFTGAENTSMNCVVGASVTVTLTTPLKAGDRIEVRPTAHMFGKDGDQRLLQASSATVGLNPSSASAPTIEVIAIEGQNMLYLRSNGERATGSTAGDVQVRSSVGAKVTVGPVTEVDGIPGLYSAELGLSAGLDLNGDSDFSDLGEANAGSDTYVLRRGDSAWAERNVFTKDNLASRYARDEVVSRVRSFRSSSVLVGTRDTGVNDDPSDDALATGHRAFRIVGNAESGAYLSQRASAYIGRGTTPDTADPNQIMISGLWSGDAAGAAGNDWQIAIDSNANYNAAAKTPEIDVSVSNRTGVAGGGLIRVQFLAGSPTLGDLAAALMGNSEFTDNFALTYNCAESRDVIDRGAFSTTSTYLTGGVSSVGIQVNWNDWVRAFPDDESDALRDDVLGSLVRVHDASASGYVALTGNAAGVAPADTDGDRQTDAASSASVVLVGGAPTMSAQIVYSTTDATRLPGLRTGSGRGAVTFGGSYFPSSGVSVGTASVDHVAVNYVTDDRDTDNDDGDNNPATGIDTARTGSSEPVDNANIGQTIRVRSGAVLSHTPGPQAVPSS